MDPADGPPDRRKRQPASPPLSKMPKLTTSSVQAFSMAIGAVGVLLTAAGLLFTGYELRRSAVEESARFALQIDDRFSTPKAVAFIDAAEHDPPVPVLTEHEGSSSDDDLEYVVGNYDTTYYLHEDGLISDQMLYDMFCGDVEPIHDNKEIERYISVTRSESPQDSDDYGGFDKLNAICRHWDATSVGHRLSH